MKWIKPLQYFTEMLRILNSKDYEQERILRTEEVKNHHSYWFKSANSHKLGLKYMKYSFLCQSTKRLFKLHPLIHASNR